MTRLWYKLFKNKEMREYRKMYKRHRKTMIKLAKEDNDWDYGFMHNIVVTKIKHMYEYYSDGNNIFLSEESLNEILKTLKHAIDLADQLENVYDDNIEDPWTREDELYKEFYSYIGEHIQWWWD